MEGSIRARKDQLRRSFRLARPLLFKSVEQDVGYVELPRAARDDGAFDSVFYLYGDWCTVAD